MSPTPELPDLSSYRAAHHAIRLAARRLAAAAVHIDPADRGRVQALQRYWKGYTGEVLVHHGLEDDVFFPALSARTPVVAQHMEQLDAEHHQLDVLMDEASEAVADFHAPGQAARAAKALAAFANLMDAHLDLEDEDVLPLFVRHFTGAEFAELEQIAIRSTGIGRQAAFTVPFVLNSMPADRRAELLRIAPLPLRVLYRLTRRSHERLERAVFGNAPAPQAARTPVGAGSVK